MTSEQEAMEAARMIIDWVELSGEGPPDAWPTTCGAAVMVARALLAAKAREAPKKWQWPYPNFTLDQIAECVLGNDDISPALTDAILAAVDLARRAASAHRAGMEEVARIARQAANDFMILRRDETDIWRDGGMAYEMIKAIRAAKEKQ